jgi:hypothetical protein
MVLMRFGVDGYRFHSADGRKRLQLWWAQQLMKP